MGNHGAIRHEAGKSQRYHAAPYTATKSTFHQLMQLREKNRRLMKLANGNHQLKLSQTKDLVLSKFNEDVYCHVFDRHNKTHISFYPDEMVTMMTHSDTIERMLRAIMCGVAYTANSTAESEYEQLPNGNYKLSLSDGKDLDVSAYANGLNDDADDQQATNSTALRRGPAAYVHILDTMKEKHMCFLSQEFLNMMECKAALKEKMDELMGEVAAAAATATTTASPTKLQALPQLIPAEVAVAEGLDWTD